MAKHTHNVYLKISDYIFQNIVAFMTVYLAGYLMYSITQFDPIGGGFFILITGAKTLIFILYGMLALPGILLACIANAFFLFDAWPSLSWEIATLLISLITLTIPFSMWIFRTLNICDCRDVSRLDFGHIVLLTVVISVLASIIKLLAYIFAVGIEMEILDFLYSHIIGNFIGSILFMYIAIKYIAPSAYLKIGRSES